MKATGYSLWLVPDADSTAYTYLRACIKELAAVYNTPDFEPHVTLLGGFSGPHNYAVNESGAIAGQLAPIEFSFTQVGSKGIYFQAFLAEAEQTPQLMSSNARAQYLFNGEKKAYFPHLSLAYGDLNAVQVATLQTLLSEKYSDLGQRGRFTANTMELWLTDGEIAEWKRIESFKLGT